MNSIQNKYDLVVIGAGIGGIISALRAKRYNLSVALIEKDLIGGASFHWGALPFQELLKVAKSYHSIKRSSDLGITGVHPDTIGLNWKKISKNALNRGLVFKDHIIETLKAKGIHIISGEATALGPNIIEVNDEIIGAEKLLIATGSNYVLPDFVPTNLDNFFTPKNFFSIKELPKTITILGAGLIGIEYSLLLSELGVKVTLIEQEGRLMKYLDGDLRKSLEQELYFHGVDVKIGHSAFDFAQGKLFVKHEHGEDEIVTDAYISAIKREANTKAVRDLSSLKLKNGFIITNQNLETSLPNVYAVGDVNGRALLAHVASKEAETAVDHMAGIDNEIVYELLHYNMYATTQMASIGMTEKVALENGFIVSIAKFWRNGVRDQYVKVVYDKTTEEVLGVHIFADNANDLICEAVYVMERSESISDFAKLIHSHPVNSMELVDQILRG